MPASTASSRRSPSSSSSPSSAPFCSSFSSLSLHCLAPLLLTLASLIISPVSAAEDVWAASHHDFQNSGRSAQTTRISKPSVESIRAVDGPVDLVLDHDGATVYAVHNDKVEALAGSAVRWTQTFPLARMAPNRLDNHHYPPILSPDADTLFLSGLGVMACATEDGSERWSHPLSIGHYVCRLPVLAQDLVVFADCDGTSSGQHRIVALAVATGNITWEYRSWVNDTALWTISERESIFMALSSAMTEAYVVLNQHTLLALDVATGRPLWNVTAPDTAAEAMYGSPTVCGDLIVVNEARGAKLQWHAFDATGKTKWTFLSAAPYASSPAPIASVSASCMLILPGCSLVEAVNGSTGDLLWSRAHEGSGCFTPLALQSPTADSGWAYGAIFDSSPPYLVALDLGDNGNPVFIYSLLQLSAGSVVISHAVLGASNSLFVTTGKWGETSHILKVTDAKAPVPTPFNPTKAFSLWWLAIVIPLGVVIIIALIQWLRHRATERKAKLAFEPWLVGDESRGSTSMGGGIGGRLESSLGYSRQTSLASVGSVISISDNGGRGGYVGPAGGRGSLQSGPSLDRRSLF